MNEIKNGLKFPMYRFEHSKFELCVVVLPFYFLPFYLPFGPEAEKAPPIIGATCAFDAKIYKNIDGVFAVSLYIAGNKKIIRISDFYFQLPTVLVENSRVSCLS